MSLPCLSKHRWLQLHEENHNIRYFVVKLSFFKKFPFFFLRWWVDLPSFAPPQLLLFVIMSKHSSLKAASTVGGKRSVLKRFERVKLMKERGQWKSGRSPIGLPKTKHEG
jgi:small basic protein (TIGR04137 family)